MVLALTGASIVAVVAVLGTGPSLRAQLPSTTDVDHRRKLVCAFTWLSVVGLVCAAPLALATCLVSARFIDPAMGYGILPLATAVFSIGQVVMLQAMEIWFADGKFRHGGLSAASMAAGGLAGLVLAAAASQTAGALLLGQALGQLAVGLAVVTRLRRADLFVISRPDKAIARHLVLHGSPALGLSLGLAIALRADRYVLGIVSGPAAVGIYSLAATVSETVRILPQSMGQLFFNDAARGAGPPQLRRSSLMACAGSAAAALVVTTIAWLAIVPVFGSAFADARGLLLPLAIAEIVLAPYAIASRGVLGHGWTRSAAAIGLLASCVAVVLYAVGAGLGGALGLALSCVVLYGFMSVTAAATFLRKYRREPGRLS